jgi:hypothetical protein
MTLVANPLPPLSGNKPGEKLALFQYNKLMYYTDIQFIILY